VDPDDVEASTVTVIVSVGPAAEWSAFRSEAWIVC
jgi:hypothetical protein